MYRVPGVLVLGIRSGCLVVYLSQERPNIQGVHAFMMQQGVPDHEYECKVLSSRFRTMQRNAAQLYRVLSVQA